MRYIKGNTTLDLFYSSSKKIEIVRYSDSDWGGDSDERKSTSGHCFMLRKTVCLTVCLWSQKKQSIVALSTCEAEYVATTTSSCQSIWLSNIMTQIGFNLDVPIKIYVDNVSAINLAKNPVFHQRSKHIDIWYHFQWDQVGKNMIKLEYCRSKDHIADILMEIKLKWTWRPIIKSKKRLRLIWRTLMELIAHLKGLQGACSRL